MSIRNEDTGFDRFLEEQYEDRYIDLYHHDAEEFERNQLALDNDFEDYYDEDYEDYYEDYYDSDEYDDPA